MPGLVRAARRKYVSLNLTPGNCVSRFDMLGGGSFLRVPITSNPGPMLADEHGTRIVNAIIFGFWYPLYRVFSNKNAFV